jgi:Zn-dependent M28 family amino/carboxypeptidase
MKLFWTKRGWTVSCVVVSTISLITAGSFSCSGGRVENAQTANGITAEDLATYTRELSDDSLKGRGTGGEGQVATLEYLGAAYERIGLAPVGDSAPRNDSAAAGQFFQEVELAGITVDPDTAALSFAGTSKAEALDLRYGPDFVTWTPEPEEAIDIEGELVFVGYGIDAPEEGWNDFHGIDVTGNILLVLVNDPPLEDQSRFGGNAMTYYGRWTYKIEEAARRGAAGVLLIHETEAAGYGWNVASKVGIGELMWAPELKVLPPLTPLQAWVSWDASGQIFRSAGLDLDELAAAAAHDGFRPVELGIKASAHLDTSTRSVTSYNVVGAFEGSDPDVADEYIVYLAHWDHLGVSEPVDGDAIYNGAIDNATGTSALLEIAEGWAVAQPAPRRSALFIATTAEEWGFFGGVTYIENPTIPLEKTLAVINIDSLNVWGPTEDMMIIGMGKSTLDDDLTAVLMEQGRRSIPDPEPEKGYYFRADHFPFALAGIPALYAPCGMSYVNQPEGYYEQVWGEYEANHYHQPSDEFDPSWNFTGAAQDVEALLHVGLRVSASDTWPEWSLGNEFKAARDAMFLNKER